MMTLIPYKLVHFSLRVVASPLKCSSDLPKLVVVPSLSCFLSHHPCDFMVTASF